jgi:hypothetical protein
MGGRTGYVPGTFCWADVGAPDAAAAAGFYGSLFGWEAEPTPGGYSMFTLDGKNVAGLFRLPDGIEATWLSYVCVEDAAATCALATERGASVAMEPRDVGPPGVDVGRSALLADPEGAVVGLWQPGLHRGADVVNEPGTMVWNQLVTPDVVTAQQLFGGLFGWTYELQDEGEQPFWLLHNREGGLNGAVMSLPAEGVQAHWQVTFAVEDTPAAAERAKELGGAVLIEPFETSIGRIAWVTDPSGAELGFFDGEGDP